jgi:glycosyltransferase involved in cell wall biosynthesis
MSRIVFVTQVMDDRHPVLGFAVGWVRALADRAEQVVVIANEVGHLPSNLGADVISLGKEWGAGRGRRGARYERALLRVKRTVRPHGLVAHMCPVYLNLAAPIARAAGWKTVLWFAHPADGPGLRLAERLAGAILTSLPGSYPRSGPKIRAIGQGIETDVFHFFPPPPVGDGVRLLALGRTSPAKGFPVAIRAVGLLRARGLEATLRIVGPSTTPQERGHGLELRRLIETEGLADSVSLEGPVPPAQVPELIASSHVLVNAMVGGTGDKVVFEAMALGRLPVVANPAFHPVLEGLALELSFTEGDERELAARIGDLARAEPSVREEVARELRARVVRDHSVDHWAEGVVRVIEELRGSDPAPTAARARKAS